MWKPTVCENLKNKVKGHEVSHSRRRLSILLEYFLSYVITAAIRITKN
jgi:hypothetical protein